MSMLAFLAKAPEEPNAGTRRGSKGSSKDKGKASVGHENEILSHLSALCISMDGRLQALEHGASHVCVVKSKA